MRRSDRMTLTTIGVKIVIVAVLGTALWIDKAKADDSWLISIMHGDGDPVTMGTDSGTPNHGPVAGPGVTLDPNGRVTDWTPDGLIDSNGDGEITSDEVNSYTDRVMGEATNHGYAVAQQAIEDQIKAMDEGGNPLDESTQQILRDAVKQP